MARIFISSTAVDLLDYRAKVRDAVLGLQNTPVAMETFSAMSGAPAAECMRLAAEADALICVVAHRYGYVPAKELGGDGERSITWLEVDAARKAGKPVFGFLIDDTAPWTGVREQDRITKEPKEKRPEILAAIDKLQEFKAYLSAGFTRATFNNADDLATKVTQALAGWIPKQTAQAARTWKPLFCHALQPAQHFRGRAAALDELKRWLESSVTPDRVVSVVAAGGTGKTALVDQALREAKLSDRAGFFVWSFYEDPNTDKFLREAFVYFTGEKDAPTSGMLERLQIALSDDLPHVLVLDGMERVQSESAHKRRGELEDLQLKRLMRWFAGARHNARALVTSRFPLADLESWNGAGHKPITLHDLEQSSALEVLRAWGVKGDNASLIKVIKPLNLNGTFHALSIAVLGSYIGNFADGSLAKTPDLTLKDLAEGDIKAQKLQQILEEYSKALTPTERDLLCRLALFPRGIRIEFLDWIVESGGAVAGALVGRSKFQIINHLERLKGLGLVFSYQSATEAVYSAHPFLRDFFRTKLAGTRPEDVHESVRARLAPSLEERPSDPEALDQYGFLIEQCLLAGKAQEAFEFYWFGIGGYRNLKNVGEFTRGLRILEQFFPDGDLTKYKTTLAARCWSHLVSDFGLLSSDVGDLRRADEALQHSLLEDRDAGSVGDECQAWANLSGVSIQGGLLRRAIEQAREAIRLAEESDNRRCEKDSLSDLGLGLFATGQIKQALKAFARATQLEGKPLYGINGIYEAECKLRLGDREGAVDQTEVNCRKSLRNSWVESMGRCNALLARLLPTTDKDKLYYLEEARAFPDPTLSVDLQLRCFHAACEVYLQIGNLSQSISEGEAGILLADTCRFGLFSIDIRLPLAEAYLAAGEYTKALQTARRALDMSEAPECQYAWGQADALHLCGIAHQRLGETELARQRLKAALVIREKLTHPCVAETKRALGELGGGKAAGV